MGGKSPLFMVLFLTATKSTVPGQQSQLAHTTHQLPLLRAKELSAFKISSGFQIKAAECGA